MPASLWLNHSTDLLLLATELAGAVVGSARWVRAGCASKLLTTYLWISVLLGVPGLVIAWRGHSNVWTVHLWILCAIVFLGQWVLIRSRARCAKHLRPLLVCVLFGWFFCAFTLGILQDYTYLHLAMAVLGLSGMICSRHSSLADWGMIAAFASDVFLCAITTYWHAEFPMFWAVRNVVWSMALALVVKGSHQ